MKTVSILLPVCQRQYVDCPSAVRCKGVEMSPISNRSGLIREKVSDYISNREMLKQAVTTHLRIRMECRQRDILERTAEALMGGAPTNAEDLPTQ